MQEPHGWVVDLVNKFGELGGFAAIQAKLHSEDIELGAVSALLQPLGVCAEYLNSSVVQPMLDPVILTTIQDVRSVEEKDLKDKLLCMRFQPDLVTVVDDLRLDILLRMLKSPHFSAKMNSLKEVTKLIEDSTLSKSVKNAIDTDRLLDWLVENSVLSIALEGNIDQAQYCDRIKGIIELLGSKLSLDELTKIWKIQSGQSSTVIENIHTIIAAAAVKFNSDQLNHLFVLIQKSWETESDRVLDVLWELAHLPTLPSSLIQQALEEHLTILSDAYAVKEAIKRSYIIKCIEDIKRSSQLNNPQFVWVVPALRQLHEITRSFIKQTYQKQDKSIIQDLKKNFEIVKLVTGSLIACHRLAAAVAGPGGLTGSTLVDGRYTYREMCFEWFTKGQHDLESDVQQQLFKEKILKLESYEITMNGSQFSTWWPHSNTCCDQSNKNAYSNCHANCSHISSVSVQAHSNETIGSVRWKIAKQLCSPVDNIQIFTNDSLLTVNKDQKLLHQLGFSDEQILTVKTSGSGTPSGSSADSSASSSSSSSGVFSSSYAMEQVLSSKLMPTADDDMARNCAKSFCENFLKAGGLSLVVNVMQRDSIPSEVDYETRQGVYSICLQLARFLLVGQTLPTLLDEDLTKDGIEALSSRPFRNVSRQTSRQMSLCGTPEKSSYRQLSVSDRSSIRVEEIIPAARVAIQTMEVSDFTSTVACFMRLSWAAAAGRLDLVGSSQPIKESNSLFPAGIRNRLSSSGSNCSSGSEGDPVALHAGICVRQQSVSTKDSLIAGEALSLLVTCLQLRSQQLASFYNLPCVADFIIDILLGSPSAEIRRVACDQLYTLSQTDTSAHPDVQKPNQFLLGVILTAQLPLWSPTSIMRGVNQRCSTVNSRLAAYEVLVMLADSSPSNLQIITKELLSMHHQPDPALTKEFDSLLSVDDDTDNPDDSVFYQVQSLFGHLMESKLQYYVPENFWKIFKMWNKELYVREQQDAYEFFTSLIDQMDEYLKKMGRDQIFKNTFQGIYSDQKICKDCPHRYEREEAFMALNLGVTSCQSLEISLDQFVRGEVLEGSNAYYCEKCKEKFPWMLNMEPYTVSGMARQDSSSEVGENGRSMDQGGGGSPRKKVALTENYELVGVIVHSGQAHAGHYYSFIKDRRGCGKGKWYKFNDTVIEEFDLNDETLEYECFGGEYRPKVYDQTNPYTDVRRRYWNAYMLFYQRVSDQNSPVLPKKSRVSVVRQEAEDLSLPNNDRLSILTKLVKKGEKKGLFVEKMPVRIYQTKLKHPCYPCMAKVSLQLAIQFLFQTYLRTKKKLRVDTEEWIATIEALLSKSFDACQWLVEYFISSEGRELIKIFLLECNVREVRVAVATILEKTLDSALFYQDKVMFALRELTGSLLALIEMVVHCCFCNEHFSFTMLHVVKVIEDPIQVERVKFVFETENGLLGKYSCLIGKSLMHHSNHVDSSRCYQCVKFLVTLAQKCPAAKEYFKENSHHWSWAVQWLQKKMSEHYWTPQSNVSNETSTGKTFQRTISAQDTLAYATALLNEKEQSGSSNGSESSPANENGERHLQQGSESPMMIGELRSDLDDVDP
ncbi:hypothetical protein CB1_000466001 [Camelus ferus]|nr:hypothetical protein CB1_000466001 [Camelus ferus]